MAILFSKDEDKGGIVEKKRRKTRIPFWGWWLLIFVASLGIVVYFIFPREIPESEIVLEIDQGLNMADLEAIEKCLKIVEGQLIQDLTPSISIPEIGAGGIVEVPSEKIGRQNPFAPVK